MDFSLFIMVPIYSCLGGFSISVLCLFAFIFCFGKMAVLYLIREIDNLRQTQKIC